MEDDLTSLMVPVAQRTSMCLHAGSVTVTAGPTGLLRQLDAYMELACGDYDSSTLKEYSGKTRSFLLDTSSLPDYWWPDLPLMVTEH